MTFLVHLLACIQYVAPGPDPGACAELPEGVYTYGEMGIGTCLAGPSDMKFFQQDGGTFLGITNADPFRLFRTGSFLVLDWDALARRLDDEDLPSVLTMDELDARAIEISDDDDEDGAVNNPFLGGFGYLPSSQTAILTSRLTEDGVLRTGRDDAYLVDLSRMELGAGMEIEGRITLEDDPQPVVVDDETGRIYVGNLSDHSVSVLEEAPSDDGLPVREVDVAADAGTSRADFDDRDASGSFAELTELAVGDVRTLVRDTFTLTFVEGTNRLFVPTPAPEDTVGIVRWSAGSGAGPYEPSPFDLEEGFEGSVEGGFVEVNDDGLPVLWFDRGGKILRAVGNLLGGDWVLGDTSTSVIRSGFDHGSPSVAPLPDGVGMWTDVHPAGGGAASIHLSTSADGLEFEDTGAVLEPGPGQSFEDPFAVYDAGSSRYRLWLSVLEGGRWHVALSESVDGRDWSEPVSVLELPDLDVAAPSLAVLDGRYGMWTTVSDGTSWQHAFSWSYDGWTWTEPVVVAPSELPFDPTNPPRAAVQAANVGAWRLEGVDQGVLPSLLPAGTAGAVRVFGLDLEVSQGHEVDNNVVKSQRGELGLVPGSVVDADGRTFLYATATGEAGHARIAVLELVDGEWTLAVDPEELEDQLGRRPGEELSSPLVVRDGDHFVLFATLSDDEGARLVRTTSRDGLSFEPVDRNDPVLTEDDTEWDDAGVYPHAIQEVGGEFVLWYTGDDGSRLRIGSASAASLDGPFTRQLGAGEEWRFGTGLPGSFDDTAVSDPMVVTVGGRTHLYYAGFDGLAWHVGHAELQGGQFVRRTDPVTGLSLASMNGLPRTFSAAGVEAPTLLSVEGGGLRLLYAGRDASARRLGLAEVPPQSLDAVYATQRFPTAGDTISFSSTDGVYGEQVMELAQSTQWYVTNGFGMSSLTNDPDRGFLYATSKLWDDLYVFDVRDDSTGDFDDANALDLETMVRVDAGSTGAGFRDAALSRTRGLLYLTQRSPEGLVVIDLDRIADDADKAPLDRAVAAVLPFPEASDRPGSPQDMGADTLANIGGAGMALTDDERFLLVTHFSQNAVSVIDLQREAYGSEIAWIPNVGENPHVVRISPDQRWAVVANYVGAVSEGGETSSSLAVIDLDPASERYLQVVTWIANR